jgi:hypothetical protein
MFSALVPDPEAKMAIFFIISNLAYLEVNAD